MSRPLLVGGFFVPNGEERADLLAAGWRMPTQVQKPKVHRVRVTVHPGGAQANDPGRAVSGRYGPPLGSAIVELTEGVFDEEWKR